MSKWTDESVRAALSQRYEMRRYPFPGAPKVEIGVKLLTDQDLDQVRLQAARFCKENKVDLLIDPDFLDRAIHRETISRAFVDPDKPADPFFPSQNDVAELDNLTVRALYELYIAHHQALDPYVACSEEEVEKLVETLGKSAESVGILSLYDFPTLRSLCISMASVLRATRPSPRSSTSSSASTSAS